MNRLEERYRRVLRLLPAWYRAVWEEEMVAALLESVDTGDPEHADYLADYGWPSWPEVASVVGLAIHLRLGGPATPPRAYAWGEGARTFALMALLVQASAGTAGVVALMRYRGYGLWYDTLGAVLVVSERLLGFLWVPAFLALVFGRWGTTRVLAGLATVPAVASAATVTVAYIDGIRGSLLTVWAYLLVSLAVLLALAGYQRDVPPVRRRPWLIALPVVLVIDLVAFALADLELVPIADDLGLFCVALAVAAVLHLRARTRRASWTLGLSLAAGTVLALRVALVIDFAFAPDFPHRAALVVAGTIEALLVVAACLPVARLAVADLRSLPNDRVTTGHGPTSD